MARELNGLLSVLAILLLAGAVARGDDDVVVDVQGVLLPSPPSTAISEQYPQVSCTGINAGVNADVLQIASDARDRLGSILQLGPTWRFPVHVAVLMPGDPLAATIQRPGVAVIGAENTLKMEVVAPFTTPDIRSFVQRQFVTELVWEKLFAHTTSFNGQTRLDVVPTWLVEGLNEWLTDDPDRNREKIVRRAARAQRAPTLDEVISWQQISNDRLLGLYQRAFCYYLVNSLVHNQLQRADFQQWLATYSKTGRLSARFLFPTESGWQRELLQAPALSHDIVYTWDESAAELDADQTITLPSKKNDGDQTCTLDTVTSAKRDDELIAALREKIFDLTSLELRAHPSWHPTIALYRFGLTALINNRPDQADQLIKEAQRQRASEIAYHQKLIDYANWFEVTKDYAGNDKSAFQSYFSAAHDLEQAQADPEHPNPIRADLLKVESQL